MKKIFIPMLTVLAISCSSSKSTNENVVNKDVENISAQTRCLKEKIGVECAKYAYSVKKINPMASYEYYKKGCDLKDSTSCYNLEQLEGSSAEANLSAIGTKSDLLLSCYSAHAVEFRESSYVRDKLGIDFEKETKSLGINVFLKENGQIKNITVDNYNVSDAAIDCIKKAFSSIRFLSSKGGQHLTYTLVVPKSYC